MTKPQPWPLRVDAYFDTYQVQFYRHPTRWVSDAGCLRLSQAVATAYHLRRTYAKVRVVTLDRSGRPHRIWWLSVNGRIKKQRRPYVRPRA